jgi:hypothetical protein
MSEDSIKTKFEQVQKELHDMRFRFMTIPKAIRMNPNFLKDMMEEKAVSIDSNEEKEKETKTEFARGSFEGVEIRIDTSVETFKVEY